MHPNFETATQTISDFENVGRVEVGSVHITFLAVGRHINTVVAPMTDADTVNVFSAVKAENLFSASSENCSSPQSVHMHDAS